MNKLITIFNSRTYGKLSFTEVNNVGLNSEGKEVILSKKKSINYIESANNFIKLIRKDKLDQIWVVSLQKWYKYEKGYWRPIHQDMINNKIIQTLGKESFNYLPKIILALKSIYLIEFLPKNLNIGFLNGVLNTSTNTFSPHSPNNYIYSIIPFNYLHIKVNKDQFTNIYSWQLFICNNNLEFVKLLFYYIHCIIFSKTQYQIFLEIQGPGGTGKSTLIKLISYLIGLDNIKSTQLHQLEHNRFETFSLINKKLIVITDSDTYGGNVNTLKAITGEDPIRIEEKNKSINLPVILNGLIIIACNEFIKSKDYTSGLSRRRITIILNNKPQVKQHLISFDSNLSLKGVFASELEFFLNYLIQLDPQDIHNFFLNIDLNPHILAIRNKVLISTNPISYFIHDSLIFKAQSQISKKELYKIYRNFCKSNGLSIISSPRFHSLFLENLKKVENYNDNFHYDHSTYFNLSLKALPSQPFSQRVPYSIGCGTSFNAQVGALLKRF